MPAQDATPEYSVLSRRVDSAQSQLHPYGVCNSMHAQGPAGKTKATSQGGGNWPFPCIERRDTSGNEIHWDYISTGRSIPVLASHSGRTSHPFQEDHSPGLETGEHYADRQPRGYR